MPENAAPPGRCKEATVVLVYLALAFLVLVIIGGIWVFERKIGRRTRGSLPVVYNKEVAAQPKDGTPHAVESTQPSAFGFTERLEVDGKEVDPKSFHRAEPVNFGPGADYTDMPGIVTFRGNNFRDSASFDFPRLTRRRFRREYWNVPTGSLEKSDISKGKGSAAWTGSGWTGQPLIMHWPEATRQIMNLYPDKKDKDLTEVLYATMDGKVYFLDIEDGSPTRDVLNLGLPFKGAGAMDPRGIPMMWCGAGDSLPDSYGPRGYARAFIFSLIDFEILYELGAKDPFAPRIFHGYDSSALVDASTDTMFYPAENAILYTMKLNTDYDPEAGTLSIDPSDIVKWTYTTDRTSEESFWWGMEDSAVIWEHYMYIADNGGNMMCIDLDTMQLVWVQDTLDDTNSSPVMEVEADGTRVLYIAASLHWQKDEETNTGVCSIFKLNATTGEKIWEKPYEVHTVYGISGGIQATPVLGKELISDLIIYPIARTPHKPDGYLVALDKKTGEERWIIKMHHYAWSSPVAVYTEDGEALIVQCDCKGNIFLIDGPSGEILDWINVGSNIEASPAVFGNRLVVGTRSRGIVGVTIE